MKDLQTIINQESVYLNDWAESGKIGLVAAFEDIDLFEDFFSSIIENKDKLDQKLKEWQGINILFASYGYGSYEGEAFVLLEKEGKLFEVNAGHCSCYGLEGQFKPEETTLEALKYRLINGKLGQDDYTVNEFANELKEFLGIA
jgi:hypothetical protein